MSAVTYFKMTIEVRVAASQRMHISSNTNTKHINVESFFVEGRVIVEDGKKYKQKEGMVSNGFKVILEFPEEAYVEDTVSIDLKNMMESLYFDGIRLP